MSIVVFSSLPLSQHGTNTNNSSLDLQSFILKILLPHPIPHRLKRVILEQFWADSEDLLTSPTQAVLRILIRVIIQHGIPDKFCGL